MKKSKGSWFICQVCGELTDLVFTTTTTTQNGNDIIQVISPPRHFCEEHQPYKADWLEDVKVTIETDDGDLQK